MTIDLASILYIVPMATIENGIPSIVKEGQSHTETVMLDNERPQDVIVDNKL